MKCSGFSWSYYHGNTMLGSAALEIIFCLLTKGRNESFDTPCRYWLAGVFHTSLNQELRAFNTQLDSFANASSIFVANLPVNLVLSNEPRTQQHDMDLVRHQYVYPHHHPYRLGGMRYGAVSPYQVVTIPRCTCECYCERNRVQFVEGESRNLSDSAREGRGRDMDDLKNGMVSFKLRCTITEFLSFTLSANKQYKCLPSSH